MMKFIRHLLSHIMFLIFISGIVAIYYFRDMVIPGEYVEKINHYAEKVHPAVVAFKHAPKKSVVVNANEEKDTGVVFEKRVAVTEVVVIPAETADNKDQRVADLAVTEKPAEVLKKEELIAPVIAVQAEMTPAEVPAADKPVSEVTALKPTVPVEKEKAKAVVEIIPVKEKVVEGVVDKKPAAEVVVEAVPVKKQEEAVAVIQEEKKQSSDAASADYKAMLQSARSLFLNKKYKESVSKYKELIELENHEADFYGELGNVYYAMGSWDMAGEAYFEAAQRLIETGNLSQVYYLQRVLQGLDKNRADKLKNHLSSLAR